MGQNTELEARDSHWQGLYRLGGVAALMIAVLLRSEVFSLATAYAGILAGAAGLEPSCSSTCQQLTLCSLLPSPCTSRPSCSCSSGLCSAAEGCTSLASCAPRLAAW